MRKEPEFSVLLLIELIYNSVLDTSQWRSFVEALAGAIDHKSSLLCLTGQYVATPQSDTLKCLECHQQADCLSRPLEHADTQLLGMLRSHVLRALRIRHHIEIYQHDLRTLQEFLCCTLAAVIVVDKHGTILYENLGAEHMIENRSLQVQNHALHLSQPNESRHLGALIRESISLKSTRVVSGTCEITLGNGHKTVVLVVPLSPDNEAGYSFRAGSAALIICKPEMLSVTRQKLIDCYSLTRGEAGLVVQLIRGMSLMQAAQELQIAYATARSYIKTIFHKMKVKRQSDLISRILTGPLGYLPQHSALNRYRSQPREE